MKSTHTTLHICITAATVLFSGISYAQSLSHLETGISKLQKRVSKLQITDTQIRPFINHVLPYMEGGVDTQGKPSIFLVVSMYTLIMAKAAQRASTVAAI